MKFTKERVKATEAEIREAWGVVLDGVKAEYSALYKGAEFYRVTRRVRGGKS